MQISVGQTTIIDLVGQLERKEIVINRDYQREAGVWPESARSYFIDTILEGYPFPKIYLYQVYSEKSKRPIKELIDGQQRVTTIVDFLDDKLRLSSTSKNFAGMKYSDLSIEKQQAFQSYLIETSLVLAATRPELLEMFRRMNAYTAPLSAAEKRHSTYQGQFKWFIIEQADEFGYVFEKYNILTSKQLARMGDAEFIADLVAVLEYGIVSKSPKNIEDLYKKYDVNFAGQADYHHILEDFFNFLNAELDELADTFLMKSYVVHSLFTAYALIKYGIKNGSVFGSSPNHNVILNIAHVVNTLREMAFAHEQQDESGKYGEYVKACLSSTTKAPQRTVRVKFLVDALLG